LTTILAECIFLIEQKENIMKKTMRTVAKENGNNPPNMFTMYDRIEWAMRNQYWGSRYVDFLEEDIEYAQFHVNKLRKAIAKLRHIAQTRGI